MESTPAYPRAEGLKTLMEIRDVLCGKQPSERCIIPLDYDRDLKPYIEGFFCGCTTHLYSGSTLSDVLEQMKHYEIYERPRDYIYHRDRRSLVCKLVCRPDSGTTAGDMSRLSEALAMLPLVDDVVFGMSVDSALTENVRLNVVSASEGFYHVFLEYAFRLLGHHREILDCPEMDMARIGDGLYMSPLGSYIEWWSRNPDLALDDSGNLILDALAVNHNTPSTLTVSPKGELVFGKCSMFRWHQINFGWSDRTGSSWGKICEKYAGKDASGALRIEEVVSRLRLSEEPATASLPPDLSEIANNMKNKDLS